MHNFYEAQGAFLDSVGKISVSGKGARRLQSAHMTAQPMVLADFYLLLNTIISKEMRAALWTRATLQALHSTRLNATPSDS